MNNIETLLGYVLIILRVLTLIVLINGIAFCFATYAVAPGKYEEDQYTKEQVQKIAYKERREGISFAYSLSQQNLYYVYLPLISLLLLQWFVGFAQKRVKK